MEQQGSKTFVCRHSWSEQSDPGWHELILIDDEQPASPDFPWKEIYELHPSGLQGDVKLAPASNISPCGAVATGAAILQISLIATGTSFWTVKTNELHHYDGQVLYQLPRDLLALLQNIISVCNISKSDFQKINSLQSDRLFFFLILFSGFPSPSQLLSCGVDFPLWWSQVECTPVCWSVFLRSARKKKQNKLLQERHLSAVIPSFFLSCHLSRPFQVSWITITSTVW